MKDWKYHCAVLGVREKASLKEIRKAFHKLALERHPDKHNGSQRANEDFRQLNESYHYLLSTLRDGGPPLETPKPAPKPTATPEAAPATPSPPATRPVAPSSTVGKFRSLWVVAAAACFAFALASALLDSSPETREEAPEIREPSAIQDTHPAPTAEENKRAEEALRPCEVVTERKEGQSTSSYRTPSDEKCRRICAEMMREKPRDGMRCSWNGEEFRRQQAARTVSEPAPEPPVPRVPAASPGQSGETALRSTCFLSVVGESGTFADSFPDDSQGQCASRCDAQILTHPTGHEIRCAFAGMQIINYVPDPIVSFFAKDPGGSGLQQGDQFVATCEIHGRERGGKKRFAPRIEVTAEEHCKALCLKTTESATKAVDIACSFNGKSFYQGTGNN